VLASLLLADKGSLDIIPVAAGLLDAAAFSGLVFSLPGIISASEKEVSMGEEEGMETSLRRPLCEPAPVGLLEESSTLISRVLLAAVPGCGCCDKASLGLEEFAAVVLFEVDVPVPCPAPAPVVDCAADPSAIGRLFRGRMQVFGEGTPPVRVYWGNILVQLRQRIN